MADFDVVVVGGAQLPWVDESTANAPSRLNSDPAYLPSYRSIPLADATNAVATVSIKAIVNGVTAPLDAALGGRLFFWAWAEWSGDAPPSVSFSPGHSSNATITFQRSANHQGHFLFRFRRPEGGVVLTPLDVILVQP